MKEEMEDQFKFNLLYLADIAKKLNKSENTTSFLGFFLLLLLFWGMHTILRCSTGVVLLELLLLISALCYNVCTNAHISEHTSEWEDS